MMTNYDVTIEGVRQAQLAALIDALPSGTPIRFKKRAERHAGTTTGSSKPAKRMSSETVLAMTGKMAKKGSQRAKILDAFEKMEKKHGIASVTRVQLRREVDRLKFDTTVVGQLIRDGYLRAVA